MNMYKYIFDNLKDKKCPGICDNNKTEVCELKIIKKEICQDCKKKVIETLNNNIPEKITLENFFSLSIEDRLEFIIRNKIWKKTIIPKYRPDITNKIAKERWIRNLERKELTLGEIYFTAQKYIEYLIEKYINQNGLIKYQIDNDKLLNAIKNEKQVTEYFTYNTRGRESELSFKVVTDRPKNTTLYQSLNYGKISDIKIIDRKNNEIEINKIQPLCTKNMKYNKLSEQISYYIKDPESFENDTGLEYKRNKEKLLAYYKIIDVVEGACETNKYQAESYVNNILKKRKHYRYNNIINDNNEFKIAPIKRKHRSVEKTITSYNGDISQSTDNSRGTIIFKTVKELTIGMIKFIDVLNYHNQIESNEQQKVKEVYFEDKYGDLLNFSRKSSGYRDGKFLIKLGDGNVIELMFHLEDMYIAKNEGFEFINNKYFYELIKKIQLSDNEIVIINNIIDKINPEGTKRGQSFLNKKSGQYKLPYINEKITCKIPADFIYNIYRNLQEYDRKKEKSGKDIDASKISIAKLTTIKKIFFLEREIYQRGYKNYIYKIKNKITKNKIDKNDSRLKSALFTNRK